MLDFFFPFNFVVVVAFFSGQANDLYMSLRLASFGSSTNTINNTADGVSVHEAPKNVHTQ